MTAPFLCSASGCSGCSGYSGTSGISGNPGTFGISGTSGIPRPDLFSSGINNKKQETLAYTSWAGTDEGIRALYFRLVLPIQVRVCQGFLLMGYVMALIPLSCVGAHVYVLFASYCAISFSCSSARAISAFSLSTRRFISSMRELPFFEETERKQILFS